MYPGALPWVMQPQPQAIRRRGPRGIRTASTGLPQLSTPTYRLEAGGGQCGVCMSAGRRRGEVVARDIGLSQPKHPTSDLG
jgi:hypothetical protein